MIEVQGQFERFHDRIKPGFDDGETILQEKRDKLKKRLERELPKIGPASESLRLQARDL